MPSERTGFGKLLELFVEESGRSYHHSNLETPRVLVSGKDLRKTCEASVLTLRLLSIGFQAKPGL